MKRLTERDKNGTAMAVCCGENCKHNFCCENGGFIECRDIDDIIDRLAAIEDILGEEYELDKLQELVEADRKGRCVVLPCKPGDTVWRIVNDAAPHTTKDKCFSIMLNNGSMWIDLIDGSMNGAYFGQRLFQTRAEAEAALKAREQDG